MRIVRVKNTGADGTWAGQTILAGEYYDLQLEDLDTWPKHALAFTDVGNGRLVVNKGADTVDDIADVVSGWEWLVNGSAFPVSEIDGVKLAVHSSPKPSITGVTSSAVWTSAGDDMTTGDLGDGPLLCFHNVPGEATQSIKFERHETNGRMWIHEGYLKFDNGGIGDYITAHIIAEATPLQTSVNLDLIIDGTSIKYSTGSPAGTHGFADASAVNLIPRTYSKDGDWDYDGVSLTPNFTETGEYKLSTVETITHKYINKIACHGSCPTYFSMTSNETTELPLHYYMEIVTYNNSNTTWDASVIVEIFRERTYKP